MADSSEPMQVRFACGGFDWKYVLPKVLLRASTVDGVPVGRERRACRDCLGASSSVKRLGGSV
jgi:hypothetical protein